MKTKKKKLIISERVNMLFDVRAADRKKFVVTYLELSVSHFEGKSKELLPRLVNLLLGGASTSADAKDTLAMFVQHIDEYKHDLEQLHELICDYIDYDDSIAARISLPENTPISQEELSRRLKESTADQKEKVENAKERVAAKVKKARSKGKKVKK